MTLDHKDFERLVHRKIPSWMRLGCAIDIILLDDLLESGKPGWRVVIAPAIHRPSALSAIRDWADQHPHSRVLLPSAPGLYVDPACARSP